MTELESDNSENIESSIECLRLNPVSSDISASDDAEMMDCAGETKSSESQKNAIHRDELRQYSKEKEDAKASESSNTVKKSHMQVSPKRKKGQMCDEEEPGTTEKDNSYQKAQTTVSKDKALATGTSPSKPSKKPTPKKSPRKSPTMVVALSYIFLF